ncbi:MAG TPA: J domain-containing protein [Polyangiaceae bacterium]|nr:J domain-containing protein [Polyangiaceae bacterium]
MRTVDPDASPLLVAVYVERGGWLREELAKVVPPPTADDEALFDLFVWPGDSFDPARVVEDRREALAKARVRLEAYKRGRRRGETPRAWWERDRAEAEAAEERRRAEEAAARHQAWWDWVRSPPGTPPPGPAWADVPPKWAEARRVWLDFEAACAAGGRPSGDGWRPRSAEPRPAESALRSAAATLGLRWPCSADEAKRTFRRLAIEHHPDRAGPGATARMAQINVAYEELEKAFAA